MIKVLLHKDVGELEPYVGGALLSRLCAWQIERFESLETISLIYFDWYNILDKTAPPQGLMIYFSAEHLFFICEDETLFAKATDLLRDFPENDRVLFAFFSELMKGDMTYLEALEDDIAELENNLLTNSKAEGAHSIVLFRKELIRLKKYYEQLNSIFEDITQNDNGLIAHEHLRHYLVLDNRVDRLFGTVLNMRDFVTQVREAYQAQIDIEQNAIMKVFTVMTSVFLPLTLIVGWYGMNLQMPEFEWQYGYPVVITLSVAVFASCLAFFKFKKWF